MNTLETTLAMTEIHTMVDIEPQRETMQRRGELVSVVETRNCSLTVTETHTKAGIDPEREIDTNTHIMCTLMSVAENQEQQYDSTCSHAHYSYLYVSVKLYILTPVLYIDFQLNIHG